MTTPIRVHDSFGGEATVSERSVNGTLVLLRTDDGREVWIDPALIDGDRLTLPLEAILQTRASLDVLQRRLIRGERVKGDRSPDASQ